MRALRYTLMSFAMLAAFAAATFAQKDGDKKPPPKGNPPVITPQPKPTPKPDQPKKPEYAIAIWKNEAGESA